MTKLEYLDWLMKMDNFGLLRFEKGIHTALWGSESWEISAHPSDPSVIADGGEKGCRLNEIYPNFPLLFKVIDAKTRLSVQVHPNEETCKVTGGEPKTEMWCALSNRVPTRPSASTTGDALAQTASRVSCTSRRAYRRLIIRCPFPFRANRLIRRSSSSRKGRSTARKS